MGRRGWGGGRRENGVSSGRDFTVKRRTKPLIPFDFQISAN